jgi:hypothetical protein
LAEIGEQRLVQAFAGQLAVETGRLYQPADLDF